MYSNFSVPLDAGLGHIVENTMPSHYTSVQSIFEDLPHQTPIDCSLVNTNDQSIVKTNKTIRSLSILGVNFQQYNYEQVVCVLDSNSGETIELTIMNAEEQLEWINLLESSWPGPQLKFEQLINKPQREQKESKRDYEQRCMDVARHSRFLTHLANYITNPNCKYSLDNCKLESVEQAFQRLSLLSDEELMRYSLSVKFPFLYEPKPMPAKIHWKYVMRGIDNDRALYHLCSDYHTLLKNGKSKKCNTGSSNCYLPEGEQWTTLRKMDYLSAMVLFLTMLGVDYIQYFKAKDSHGNRKIRKRTPEQMAPVIINNELKQENSCVENKAEFVAKKKQKKHAVKIEEGTDVSTTIAATPSPIISNSSFIELNVKTTQSFNLNQISMEQLGANLLCSSSPILYNSYQPYEFPQTSSLNDDCTMFEQSFQTTITTTENSFDFSATVSTSSNGDDLLSLPELDYSSSVFHDSDALMQNEFMESNPYILANSSNPVAWKEIDQSHRELIQF